MAGVEQRVEPLEAGDPGTDLCSDSLGDRRETCAEACHDTFAFGFAVERRGYAADVHEHPLNVRRIERHDQRLAIETRGDSIERDGAHRAERLAEDHVRTRVAQGLLVQVKGALAAGAGLADVGVDLARCRVSRDRRSRDAG